MNTPGHSPSASSWSGSPTFPASAASSQFFFDRRESEASTVVASPAETIRLKELPKLDTYHLDDIAREHQAPQEIALARDDGDDEHASRRSSKDVQLDTDAKADGKDAAGPPTHGRLLPLRQFLLCYACLAIAVFLTALDQTIVACILPNIASDFGSSSLSWVGTAYLLTQTTFSPMYGRMSDVFGRKALFLIAQAIFFIGVLICALAPTMPVLIVGRAISGIGGAGLFSMVHVCVSDIVTLQKRGIYHGILSSVNGAGSAIGPLMGGVLVSSPIKWRLAFYAQLPIVLIGSVGTVFFLPRIGVSDRRLLKAKLKTIDYVGMVLFLAGATLVLVAINFVKPPSNPFTAPNVIAPFIAGIATLVAFAVWEGKWAIQPIVPLKIFTNVSVDQIFILNASFGYVFYSSLYYIPEFFQVVRNQDAIGASVSLMPLVVSAIALSWLTGLLTSTWGTYKWSLLIAFGLQTLGSVLVYVYFRPGFQSLQAIGIMFLLGISFGCQMQNTLVAVQAATRQREVAMATTVRNFFRNGGGVLGLAISGALKHTAMPGHFNYALSSHFPDEAVDRFEDDPLSIAKAFPDPTDPLRIKAVEAYAESLRIVFLVFIPISALAFLVSIILPEYRLDRDEEGEPVRKRGLVAILASRIKMAPSRA